MYAIFWKNIVIINSATNVIGVTKYGNFNLTELTHIIWRFSFKIKETKKFKYPDFFVASTSDRMIARY